MIHSLSRIIKRLYAASIPVRTSTSLSDNQAYPQVCTQASHDYRLFNNFRRNSTYNQILEHVSEKQGSEYLRLLASHPDILAAIEIFKMNDKFGNPKMHEYPKVGKISPSTLRYVKVLSDLKLHFKTVDNFNIAEIGVGYGGQCRVVNAFYKPATYCLIDIKPALDLAQRYLDNFALHSVVTYSTMNELTKNTYDLVVSNYAFSELPRTIQDVYLNRVILHSKRGYITYNEITPSEFKSYKSDELVTIIPGSKILAEVPLTHPRNCIIAWGTDA